MTDATATRSAVLERQEERRAMHEGYVFLDEKCLLLAGEIVRELAVHRAHAERFEAARREATRALEAAVRRHGIEDLQLLPAPADETTLQCAHRALMGVPLQDATLHGAIVEPPGGVAASPEAAGATRAFHALVGAAVPLAASAGNLARLAREYRRSVRRARALQDVLLPELDRTLRELTTRLEEAEQEDAVAMRCGRPRAD